MEKHALSFHFLLAYCRDSKKRVLKNDKKIDIIISVKLGEFIRKNNSKEGVI